MPSRVPSKILSMSFNIRLFNFRAFLRVYDFHQRSPLMVIKPLKPTVACYGGLNFCSSLQNGVRPSHEGLQTLTVVLQLGLPSCSCSLPAKPPSPSWSRRTCGRFPATRRCSRTPGCQTSPGRWSWSCAPDGGTDNPGRVKTIIRNRGLF